MLTYIAALLRSRVVVTLMLAATGPAGCGRDETPRGAPAERQALRRGDRVVVEAKAAEFFEGRVLSVDKDQLRIEVPAREPLVVSRADVYRLPPEAPVPREGAFAVCRLKDGWHACRVSGRDGERVRVEAPPEERATLSRDAVLAPSALTELNLRQRFARVAERAEFAASAARAGRPVPPPGFRALPRARVIARRGNGWYSGNIHELDDHGAYVEFRSDGLREHVARADIVPEPSSGAPHVRGAFVLVRPHSPTEAWKVVRVLGATENEIKVSDENGEERLALPRDLLPLVP